ncbi:MAG: SGNH/GDSL hydrolase family protein [Fuerstiella sp.]|nr:SGNH/GDSL hydrolase family protein [Fuerstiella sp.]
MKTKTPEAIGSTEKKVKRSLSKKVLVFSCATLAGFMLGEVLLRLMGISYPELYTPDPHCASRLSPGASGWWISEGRSFVRINSDGLRDREHEPAKPTGAFRIAILGDSYTEALQVAAEKSFWAVAERQLRRSNLFDGREPEFVNFGVSGYGTAQELLTLRSRVWKYDPDLVLVAFCHNDIQDNSRDLGGGETRPYFLLRDDELHLDKSFLESAGYLTALTRYEKTKAQVVNMSYMLQVLKQTKRRWHLQRERPEKSNPHFEDTGSDFNVYEAPRTPVEKAAWNITERLILEIRADAMKKRAKFGLITVTTPLQVHPDSELRRQATNKSPASHLLYAEHRLEKLAEDHNFPILTLARQFKKRAESGNIFLHGFSNTQPGTGHWNETGHEMAGHYLAEWLEYKVLN